MPDRVYFSRRCRGLLVEILQRGLMRAGVAPAPLVKFDDGDFGGKTEIAVRALQQKEGRPQTGKVDEATWTSATGEPVPSIFQRVLQLTADFEGHGFGLAQGNFDGAGITWGVIGFTLDGGELGRLTLEADAREPGVLNAAFGALASEWRSVLKKPRDLQLEWADSVTVSKKTGLLAPSWAQAFARLGAVPSVQALQIEAAHGRYFKQAVESAAQLGLRTERGLALCFDTHVQSGHVRPAVFHAGAQLPASMKESERLPVLADAIADAVTKKQYVEDVRSRRRCIATGAGTVHGANYTVGAWGIGLAAHGH